MKDGLSAVDNIKSSQGEISFCAVTYFKLDLQKARKKGKHFVRMHLIFKPVTNIQIVHRNVHTKLDLDCS